MEALHCKPLTLAIISENEGKYLVGLKDNQKELKKQMTWAMENQAMLLKIEKQEKGHGRA